MAITFTNLTGDWRRIVEDYVTDPANAADSPGVEGTITVTPVLGEGRHAPRGVPADGIFYTLDSLDLRVYRGLLRDPNMNADIKVAIEIDGYPVAWRASFDLQYRRVRIPLHDVVFGPNEIVDGQISLSSLVARDGVPPEYEGSYVQLMDAVAQAAAARDAAESHADRAESIAAGVEDAAQIVTDNVDAINDLPANIDAVNAARAGAESARDEAQGHATSAGGSASAAAQSAADADGHRAAAALSETSAGQSATDADQHRQAAEGHATDAATALSGAESARDAAQQARSGAEDERVVAQDAAALAEGHAQAADGHRVDAEAAAALAQSLRWVVKGAWSPGQYEAGDVVVWGERAYYAQTATSVEPPAQPWIPLTPAGGGGASHWDDLDGKPSVFPPEAHGHDAADVTGEATPLLDLTQAMIRDEWGMVGEDLTAGSLLAGLAGNSDRLAALESGKADTNHTHTTADVDGLQAALDDKADVDHTHTPADVGAVANEGGATGLWIGDENNLPATGTAGVLYVTYE